MRTTSKRRRILTGLGATIAAAILLTACASPAGAPQSSASGAAEVTPVRVGITSSFNNATMNLAIDADLGEPYGIDLERTTIAGAGSTNQVAALLAGDVDVAVGGTNTIVDAIAQGAPLQIIAGMAPLLFSVTVSNAAAERTGVDPDDDIEDRLLALKGMKIAVSPPGSTGNIVLSTMLESVGLDPATDVQLVPLNDLGAVPAGLIQGVYDASFAAIGTGDVAVASGDAVTWVSLPRGDMEDLEDYVGIVAYASKDFIAENPEVAAAVHSSLNDAQELTVDDPEGVGEILKESVFAEMDGDVFAEAWQQAQDAYTVGSSFTEMNWDTFTALFDETSENDYAAIEYDDLVAEFARGR